jgi:hypothetical protein
VTSASPQPRSFPRPHQAQLDQLDSTIARLGVTRSSPSSQALAAAALQTARAVVVKLRGAGSLRVGIAGRVILMRGVVFQARSSGLACVPDGTRACDAPVNLIGWNLDAPDEEVLWIKAPPGSTSVDSGGGLATVTRIRLGDTVSVKARSGRLVFNVESTVGSCGTMQFSPLPLRAYVEPRDRDASRRVYSCERNSFDIAFNGELAPHRPGTAPLTLSFIAPRVPGVVATWHGLLNPCPALGDCGWR